MNTVFFDLPSARTALKPFTFTRPVAELRVGILTLREKWQHYLGNHSAAAQFSHLTEPYLQQKYPLRWGEDNWLVNAAVCPTAHTTDQVAGLETRESLWQDETWIAARIPREDLPNPTHQEADDYSAWAQHVVETVKSYTVVQQPEASDVINHCWDIFKHNGHQIDQDYALLTAERNSAPVEDPYTRLYRPEQIFIEEGAIIRAAIINAEEGPVYIGKNAMIHENAVVKGPFALLEGAHVNMGSKIRNATTIGPHCKVGGEVKNTVFLANSNKGHEGFVGNSVVGEWCNFGADTNTSNLKNNYQSVRLWDYEKKAYEPTGQQFCGLMMGDHSKCGINTMFNTGTVVGVFANIFGSGFPAKFIPSFTWGGTTEETSTYRFDKAIEVYERVLARRNQTLSEDEAAILQHVYQHRHHEFPE